MVRRSSFHLENATKGEIIPIVKDNLDRESHLMTDESNRYTKVGQEFANHGVVNHSREEWGYTGPQHWRKNQHQHR